MSAKKVLSSLLFLIAFGVYSEAASAVIVRPSKNAKINDIAASMGATILDSMPDGTSFLLSVSSVPGTLPSGVDSMTADTAIILPRFKGAALTVAPSPAGLPWFTKQPAFDRIHAEAGRVRATGRGIIIADIDSAIDTTHPDLQGHLTAGKDFVGNGNMKTRTGATLQQSTASFLDQSTASFLDQSTASFLDQSTASFLDQSTASFLDQSTASFLDQSTASFLDQSTASFLDQSTASFLDSNNAGHGHATMVAGLMVAIAPDAMIMPLRAFDDTGTGDAFVVAKAIRYAVQNGAHVINLSLGLSSDASEVRSAISFAISKGVIVVVAVGNSNSSQPQYPADYDGVVGVASTDNYDQKASFSNYGESVYVSAPGVELITAYPNGYAVASGTSFSSAIVAAEAALLRSLSPKGILEAVATGSENIDGPNPSYVGQLGYGRINIEAAILALSLPQSQSTPVTTPASRGNGRYIVRFIPGLGRSDRAAEVSNAGGKVRFDYDVVEAMAIEVPEQALNGLQHNPNVIEIVPDRPVTVSFMGMMRGSTAPAQVTPSGVTRVGASLTGSDGTGVGVAILDTGIDLLNTDLAVSTKSYSAFGASCQDDNGHGTAVAGLISALNNTIGVVGVAPKSTPYCVKVLDSAGNGSDSNIIAGLNWVYQNWNLVTPNIRVVNMSLGRAGTISDNSSYRTAIQNLYNLGIVIVTAAGNDATVTTSQRVPMAYPEVINVASTTALKGTTACRTQTALLADSASYYTTDGAFDSIAKTGITISAPGEDQENISSTCTVSSIGMLTLNRGSGTVRASGTSVSAPLVAGVVARLIQKGNSGVETIRNLIRTSAQLKGTAPIDSRITGYTFDGEREGIAKAP